MIRFVAPRVLGQVAHREMPPRNGLCQRVGVDVAAHGGADTQRHREPHFHVRHQGAEAVFRIDGTRLDGNPGPRAERLVAE